MKFRFSSIGVAGWLAPAMLIFMTIMLPIAAAQTITIRLLNGKTGEPMPNENITVHWAGDIGSDFIVALDNHGVARMTVPSGRTTFMLQEGPRKGKEPNRVAYLDCNSPRTLDISVRRVIETGYVPSNECGSRTYDPHPGDVVFWARPVPWWWPDMQ